MFKKLLSDNKAVMPWLKSLLKKYFPKIFFLTLISASASVLAALSAYVSRYLIDSAVGKDMNGLVKFSIITGAVVLLFVLMRFFNGLLNASLQINMTRNLRSEYISTLFDKDYLAVTSYHSGDLMTRFTNDIDTVVNGMTSILPSVTGLVFQIISAFIALFLLDKKLAVFFLAFGFAFSFGIRLFRKYLKDLYLHVQRADSTARSFAQEVIENILVVTVFRAEKDVCRKSDELLGDFAHKALKRSRVFVSGRAALILGFRGAYAAVCVICAFRLFNESISYGVLTAMLALVSQLQSPFRSASGILPAYYNMLASSERILEISQIKSSPAGSEIADPKKFYDDVLSFDFKNVSFSYGRDEVLDDADVTVNKGDFAAITGISGIGKSTMLKMLLSVITPTSGTVTINTLGGEVPVDPGCRSLFSYVPQGNMLLSGTIRENITFMSEGRSQEEIDRAVRISCSDDFIKDLPDGLETIIGERGRGLSEGQIQRLAIARAVLHDSPVILLDEATSALDEMTEERVLRNLKEIENCTLIIVSHKKAALSVCNKEIRIENKKFVTKDLTP